MSKRRVVITGMGIASCFGTDLNTFYQRLLNGESGVGPITEFQVDDLSTRFAMWVKDFDPTDYVEYRLVRRGDPFLVYGVYAGKRALEDAGLLDDQELAKLDKTRCGIIIGSGMGGMTMYTDTCEVLREKGIRRVSPFFVPYIITNMGGALLAIDLGFQGPNYSVSTACSTASYSIVSAMNHIRSGCADLMLAGGVEGSKNRMCIAGFVACRALSERNDEPEKASRPFDESRDGFVLGEGGGVLVLEEYEHAKRRGARIYAELCGGALNCDAYHMTSTREDGTTIAACIQDALRDGGVAPEQVDYINAHATATKIGDKGELTGMNHIFKGQKKMPIVNATKSMIGHALGGAAGLEVVATVLQMHNQVMHPTINLENPIPEIDGYRVPTTAEEHQTRYALKSSFGFGGHNACLVIGAPPMA